MRAVIREELGADPEELWATFDPVPIASASLAQVVGASFPSNRSRGLTIYIGGRACVRAIVHRYLFTILKNKTIPPPPTHQPNPKTKHPPPHTRPQVHLATEKGTGRRLAVKVQHRGLREISRGDVAAVCFFVNLVASVFPEFSYRWVRG